MRNETEERNAFQPIAGRVTTALAVMAALVCVVDLCGWWLRIPALLGLSAQAATMKPNTGVGILLIAICIAVRAGLRSGSKIAGTICGLALLVFGATLVEYIAHVDLHIDRLLTNVPWDSAGDPLGRMSMGSALDGCLLSVAVLLADWFPFGASVFAGTSCALSLSALVGFLFTAAPLLGVSALRSMTVQTAAAFLILGIAYFTLFPDREPARSLLESSRPHRAGLWFLLGTCSLPIVLGLPAAALYRHHWMDASFAFATLVVGLVVMQTLLVIKNSQSLTAIERHRNQAEEGRRELAAQNERQHEVLSESERRAAQSADQYRLITDALPALVSYLNRDLCYVSVNRTYETWFGLPASEVVGKSLEEVLGPSAANVRPRLQEALTGLPQQFEASLMTLQGERTVRLSHIPDVDTDGSVRGVVIHGNDVTARRREEAVLRQTEKLAAVGKLASSIAHEINNPLESVTNLLYLAREQAEAPELSGYLALAEKELQRVSAITSHTLRFHKQATRPSAVQAPDLFATVLAIYRPRLARSVSLDEAHRPGGNIVCMDGEIRQVLNNLVGNALDAMPSAGGRLHIRSRPATSWRSGRTGMVFTVADNGTGMSAKTIATIFEAFFTTKGTNGTGLGLWVSKEIVDRHNGDLRVRSSQAERMHGTVFRLFLPFESDIGAGSAQGDGSVAAASTSLV